MYEILKNHGKRVKIINDSQIVDCDGIYDINTLELFDALITKKENGYLVETINKLGIQTNMYFYESLLGYLGY